MGGNPDVPKRFLARMDRTNMILCVVLILCICAPIFLGREDSDVKAEELAASTSSTASQVTAAPAAEVQTVGMWQGTRMSSEEESRATLDDLLERVKSIGPRDMEPSDLSRIGKLLMKQGKYDDAATYFEALIQNHPDSPAIRYAWDPLVRCYKETGNRSAMLATYRRVLDFSIEGTWLHEYALEGLQNN